MFIDSNTTSPGTGIKIKPSEYMMSPNALNRKTLKDRTFSSVEAGSVRGSIFSLVSSAVGAGVLSLPYVLALNGYVIGIFLLFVGAISGNWSN